MKRLGWILFTLSLVSVSCGGSKKKSDNSDIPLDPPVHKATECPNLVGAYRGKAQNQTLVYEFVKAGNAYVVNVTVPSLSNKASSINIDGKVHGTQAGKAAYGCENGNLNATSIISGTKNKATLVPNADGTDGFELQEELPNKSKSQFYKQVD